MPGAMQRAVNNEKGKVKNAKLGGANYQRTFKFAPIREIRVLPRGRKFEGLGGIPSSLWLKRGEPGSGYSRS